MDNQHMQIDPSLPPVTEESKVPVSSVTDEQIQEIALGLHRRQIFCDRHIPQPQWEDMVPSVFLTIGLGGFGNVDVTTLGLVWEHLDKAGPRSINGFPMFFSCNLLNKEDAEKVMVIVRRLKEAEKAVLGVSG